MNSGIIAEKLTKVFVYRKRRGWFRSSRDSKTAVQDLSLQAPPGQVIGLLGLNGAGKTTTIKMLSALLLPTSGCITIDGLDAIRHPMLIRKKVNMIAGGERMIYSHLTAWENLWYFAQLYDVESCEIEKHIAYLLHLVGLEQAAHTVVERYSKGMKQRLQIARGLINNPDYLFLDEPTIGLDAPIARDLRQQIRQLAASGKGILLTSHYLKEVEELCSYVYVIDQGRLIIEGTPEALKRRTHQQYRTRAFISLFPTTAQHAVEQVARATGAKMTWEEAPDGTIITLQHTTNLSGEIATAVVSNNGVLVKLEVIEPTLEDALLSLTDEHSERGAFL
jgi:ABC-2 type transport system ATP-binding protein